MVSTRSSAKKKLVEAEAEAEAEVKTVHGGMAKGATICGFSVFLLMTVSIIRILFHLSLLSRWRWTCLYARFVQPYTEGGREGGKDTIPWL